MPQEDRSDQRPPGESEYSVTGGLTLPDKSFNVTWPLAQASVFDAGLEIRVRKLGVKMLTNMAGQIESDKVYAFFKWSELDHIDRSPRSIVVVGNQGPQWRFVTFTPAKLTRLIELVHRHKVAINVIQSTSGWFFRR